jgi:hypothetical protein
LIANVPAATGTPVTLTWTDNATNESYYLVEVSIDGGLTYQSLANVPGSTAPTGKGPVTYVAAAKLGFNNMYRVTAVVADATGAKALTSLPAMVTANLLAPAAPATPVFTARTTRIANTTGTVSLNWNAVPGATGYLVTINGGTPIPVNTTTYAAVLTPGNVYTFTVIAQASRFSGALTTNSAASAAFVADLPVAPDTVVATSTPAARGTGPITVTWNQTPSASVTGFWVQRRTVDALGVRGVWSGNVCSTAATVLTCTITRGNTKGTIYEFQVLARTAFGTLASLPSATVTAK